MKSINRADMSATAKTIFIELMCNANQKKPHVFIDVNALSQSIGRAASTIRKAVRELIAKGFLIWEGLVVQLKHKIYKLIFGNAASVETKSPDKTQSKPPFDAPASPGDRVVPASQRAEYGELITCLTQFGVRRDSITQLLYTHNLDRCRELVLAFMKQWRVDNNLSAEVWFQKYCHSRPPQIDVAA